MTLAFPREQLQVSRPIIWVFCHLLNLRGSLRCKETCEFHTAQIQGNCNPDGFLGWYMTLNTLGLQNGDVDQITPPQELAWNLEMKRNIIWTIRFHLGLPAVGDDHVPDQKEQAEKIHKKPAVKGPTNFDCFANLTTSIKQVLSAGNRKLLFVQIEPHVFHFTWHVDVCWLWKFTSLPKLVQICRSCFAFKKRPSWRNKTSDLGMFLVVERQAGTKPRQGGLNHD